MRVVAAAPDSEPVGMHLPRPSYTVTYAGPDFTRRDIQADTETWLSIDKLFNYVASTPDTAILPAGEMEMTTHLQTTAASVPGLSANTVLAHSSVHNGYAASELTPSEKPGGSMADSRCHHPAVILQRLSHLSGELLQDLRACEDCSASRADSSVVATSSVATQAPPLEDPKIEHQDIGPMLKGSGEFLDIAARVIAALCRSDNYLDTPHGGPLVFSSSQPGLRQPSRRLSY